MKGTAVKHVKCEQCEQEYVYIVERKAKGHGASMGFSSGEGAQDRAKKKAKKTLDSELANAIEPVPCINCGWIQKDMIREARRRYLRWLFVVGLVVTFIAALVLLVILVNSLSNRAGSFLTWTYVALGAGVVMLVTRTVLVNKYDPNVTEKELWAERAKGKVMTLEQYEATSKKEKEAMSRRAPTRVKQSAAISA